MKTGARNQIEASVTEIKKGTVMCQVRVALKAAPTVQMSSVMTLDSLKELGIKVGDKVYVLVKAVNVLLATD